MLTNCLLLLMFVLSILSRSAQAFLNVKNMNWTKDPGFAWPYTRHHTEFKAVIFVLNKNNYLGNGQEYTFIASGVLLDNSRILTSYNPFRDLIDDPEITDLIVALLPVGAYSEAEGGPYKKSKLLIANIVCGRQITEDTILPEIMNIFRGEGSPTHDLMIVRLEEEVGNRGADPKKKMIAAEFHDFINKTWWNIGGTSIEGQSAVKSIPAGITDHIGPEVVILTLGYESEKQMREFDTIHIIEYNTEDDVLVDCEEWLPRQWGYFICIRNIDNNPGLGSGAALYSGVKLFGIGSFAMFKEGLGILVFTDVRPYTELIEKTCGDEEFT